MILSDKTDELFAAFAKFQGELESASKGKQGHGYKYADLAECINTAKPVLAANGLGITQMLGSIEGQQTLITALTHSSGQYMSSEVVMVEAELKGGGSNNPVQKLGSAITYHRRYAFAAIIGLAQEDEDAAGFVKPKKDAEIKWWSGVSPNKAEVQEWVKAGRTPEAVIEHLTKTLGYGVSKKERQWIKEL